MSVLRTAWRELAGLFVDDARFALFIAGWVILCAIILPRAGLPPFLSPILLPLGLALILIESAIARARTHQK